MADSHMGPLVSADQLATVERYVALGREEGLALLRVENSSHWTGWKEGSTIRPPFLPT